MQIKTPVVLCIFKRPDLTQQVFNAIAQAKPQKLFVIADGPRTSEEAILCEKTRSIIQQVDWDCEVFTNFSTENMKGPWRISSGLDWVFSQVEEAIILEDDCLPAPSFFQFCQTLLEYYRHDERIMHISGNNFQFDNHRTNYSYYFSKYGHNWGWATWKRAWKHFQLRIPDWQEFQQSGLFEFACDSSDERDYFGQILERVYSGESVHWDYAWLFACWRQGGLAILPNKNLVANIGFRADAVHTKDPNSPFSKIPTSDIWEIQHPRFIIRHQDADQFTFEQMFGGRQMKNTVEHLQVQHLQAQLVQAQAQLVQTQEKLEYFRKLLKETRKQRNDIKIKLKNYRRETAEKIAAMESSIFWKFRTFLGKAKNTFFKVGLR